MQDSSSVSTTFRDIEGTSIEAWNSVIYGNEFYDLLSVDNQGQRAINLYNSNTFRNNIVRDIKGGNIAIQVNWNNIVSENIVGLYWRPWACWII